MRKILLLTLLLSLTLLYACSDDKDENVKELTIDKTELFLLPNETASFNILSGNGNYVVRSTNEKLIEASVSGNTINVKSKGTDQIANAVIYLLDGAGQTVTVKVVVSKEFELLIDKAQVTLYAGVENQNTVAVRVRSGNSGYKAIIQDSHNNSISLDTLGLAISGRFIINAKNAGNAKVKITDAKSKEIIVNINVLSPNQISVDKTDILITAVQAEDKLNVLTGNGQYKVVFDNPLIAKTVIDGGEITFVAMRSGITTAVIEDVRGQRSEPINVKVDATPYAMRFGTDYFAYATFGNIATVDTSIKNCEQVTFELTCKMLGYRGLQTFMGLEGKLILRGKNDDYKPTHPIEIAGLSDKIMLLTTNNFNLNEWMHLAFVVDCSKEDVLEKYKLYINGVQETLIVNKQEQTHSSVDLTSSNDGNRFVIGRATKQTWRAMNGIVSEARVWTVARSQQQIQDNMCSFIEKEPATGLLARWDFTAGISTNYIQDINGGKYQTNLIIANAQKDNYDQVIAPASVFVEKGCPN